MGYITTYPSLFPSSPYIGSWSNGPVGRQTSGPVLLLGPHPEAGRRTRRGARGGTGKDGDKEEPEIEWTTIARMCIYFSARVENVTFEPHHVCEENGSGRG